MRCGALRFFENPVRPALATMTDDGTKLSMKEKLFDFMVSASNAVSKTSNVSTFATTGKLTPEEVRSPRFPSNDPYSDVQLILMRDMRWRLTGVWFVRC